MPELNQNIEYLLESTPPVCSGYDFHWPAGKVPYFVAPDGKIITCKMKGKVPVISSEESVASPASIDTSQKPAGAQVFNAGSVKVELTGGACPGRVFGFPVDSRPRGPAEEGESERVVHSDPELEEAINSALPIALKPTI